MSHPVFYVPSGDVLPIFFNTFDSNGASITLTGLAVTDIEIYKDGSVTQRASDAGYTLLDTDGIDFDALTGIHGFSIDTGDNTDAGFYTVGAWYHVVVSAVTVDTRTVSFVAAAFRIMAAEGVAGVPDVNTTHAADTAWGSGAITAAAIADGAIDAATFAANAITDAVVAADVTIASVTGAVGSVTGAVGSVTGAVGSVTGAVGSVTAGVTLADDAITAAKIAANAIGASELAADVITDIFEGTALTESYAADGAAATPAQLLYAIHQMLSEFAISSTTITTKKLDKATTAMTHTLDDAGTPTSRTRAT